MIAKIKMFIILILVSGCARLNVGQDPKGVAPVSTKTSDVWRLRRLAIAPIPYEFSNGGERQTETENSTRREIPSATRKILSDEKGYEVIPLQIYEDIIPQKFHISEEQFKQHLDLVTDWADSSGGSEQPPEGIAIAVSKLGRPLDVDGIVILRGFISIPSTAKCIGNALLLTGPLFPLGAPYFCRMESHLRTDIFEVSTGRNVWRREWRRPHLDPGPIDLSPGVGLHRLFESLNQAALKDRTDVRR